MLAFADLRPMQAIDDSGQRVIEDEKGKLRAEARQVIRLQEPAS